MWSPRRPCWRIGLAQGKLVRVRVGGLTGRRVLAWDQVRLPAPAGGLTQAPWSAALAALGQWLAEPGAGAPAVTVVLSGRFVRWKLIPWRAELSGVAEVQAHAQLSFRDAFGPAADGWTVRLGPQAPHRDLPACAVDTALLQGLRQACADAGGHVVAVAPYFAAAADHWRSRWAARTAWFGVLEDDCASLSLVHDGHWRGLYMLPLDGAPAQAMAGTMAQMGIASGLSLENAPLFLAGTGRPETLAIGRPVHWLQAGPVDAQACRFALGL